MATYTPNLNLEKPSGSDKASPTPYNNNMDIIDGAISELNDTINETMQWKLAGETTGTAEISLPNNYNEIMVCMNNDMTYIAPIQILPQEGTIMPTINRKDRRGLGVGYYWTDATFEISKTKVKLYSGYSGYGQYGSGWYGDSEITSTINVKVFYR